MRTHISIHLSTTNYDLLAQKADLAGAGVPVSTIAKEILDNWCADRRSEKRFAVDRAHYTQRDGSDFEEVDA